MSSMIFEHAQSNFRGFIAILFQESWRCLRIWVQTIALGALSPLLYLILFGRILGPRLSAGSGIDNSAFIFPGLLVTTAITAASGNVCSSFFSAKYFGSIEALLTAPVAPWVIVCGYVGGGVFRSALVCSFFALISYIFVPIQCVSWLGLSSVLLVTGLIFALLGLTSGLLARSYDEVGVLTSLILTPLTYFSGSLYPLNDLTPFWKNVSKLNPISHLVTAARLACLGQQQIGDFNFVGYVCVVIVSLITLMGINVWLIQKEGYGCLG